MLIFYNIGIALYSLSVRVAALFNAKAKKFVDGRKDIFMKMEEAIDGEEGIIWIHAASLGEFEQGRPIIESIKEENPDAKILLTFFSPSGYEIRKNYMYADYTFYLPIDNKHNAARFIEIVQPRKAIFIKYEYWYYYISELERWNIPSYMVSAIIRSDHIFFKWYGVFYKRMLKSFKHFFVQNQESKQLLEKLEITNVTVAGDTRFDRVYETAFDAPRNEIVETFKGSDKIIIAGSTWEPDEKILIDYLQAMPEGWKLIIAPHEVDEAHIQKITSKLYDSFARYTQTDAKDVFGAKVLIIDTIGILSSAYTYGDVAYIGGGFGVGIHNTLEAATFGLPVVFGPNYKKFQEAKDLVEKGAAKSIAGYDECVAYFNEVLTDDKLRNKKGKAAKRYVSKNLGATSKILDAVGY